MLNRLFSVAQGKETGGSPLSPYLFILVLEILFIQVRSNTDILGFTIEDISLKLSAYAADAYYFLKDIASLQVILNPEHLVVLSAGPIPHNSIHLLIITTDFVALY